MRRRNFVSGVGEFFGIMDSAIRVTHAVRSRAQPKASDLVKLGIDPTRFREIKFR